MDEYRSPEYRSPFSFRHTADVFDFADSLSEYRETKLQQLNDPAYQASRDQRLREHFDCVKCTDEGYYSAKGEDGGWVRKDCEDCAEVRSRARFDRELKARRDYAALPGVLPQKTFESFRVSGTGGVLSDAWTHARNYAEGESRSRPWLALRSKEPGTGKTHLAAAIVNHRITAFDLPKAKWIDVAWWLNRLRRGFKDGTYDETLETAMAAPCLVLDDFGSEYHRRRQDDAESWASEQLYLVINHRYALRMETVITSNLPTDAIPPRLASRIGDGGTELVRTIYMETRDYRTSG